MNIGSIKSDNTHNIDTTFIAHEISKFYAIFTLVFFSNGNEDYGLADTK
jgi:hypothetical protein